MTRDRHKCRSPGASTRAVGFALGLAVLTGLSVQALHAVAVPQKAPARVVAIGDIHGDFDSFVNILRHAGLIDERLAWSGGAATLVQTGDFTDRGPRVRQVMDLLMSLERQAPLAGGRVVVLLGNHEVMNLLGEFRDVAPGAYDAFADERSDERRARAHGAYASLMAARAAALGVALPVQDEAAWDTCPITGASLPTRWTGSSGPPPEELRNDSQSDRRIARPWLPVRARAIAPDVPAADGCRRCLARGCVTHPRAGEAIGRLTQRERCPRAHSETNAGPRCASRRPTPRK